MTIQSEIKTSLDILFASYLNSTFLETFGCLAQYDEPDLNKSQKSRPKTPTASKVIS